MEAGGQAFRQLYTPAFFGTDEEIDLLKGVEPQVILDVMVVFYIAGRNAGDFGEYFTDFGFEGAFFYLGGRG